MAITYPITLPIAPRSYSLTPRSVVSSSASIFTGEQYVQAYDGQWWELSLIFSQGNRTTHAALVSAINSLKGKYGTFKFQLVGDEATPRGVATGTPLVKGASQERSSTLETDGWTHSITGILKAGDFIQIGDYLYQVLVDANSDSSGNATLEVFPRVRSGVADNDAIIASSPSGIFRLSGGSSYQFGLGGIYSEISISAIEAI